MSVWVVIATPVPIGARDYARPVVADRRQSRVFWSASDGVAQEDGA